MAEMCSAIDLDYNETGSKNKYFDSLTVPLSTSSMATGDQHNHKDNKEQLRPLLVFGPPTIFPVFEAQNFHNYRFLKAFSSQVPLRQFLTEQKVDPSSIQAIFCNPVQKVSADVIRLLPSLRIIVTSSTGTDHIDLVECSRHGIQVVSTAGDHAGDVADMAVGLLLDVMWKISAADLHVRKWGPSMPLNLSFGSKVLLILLLVQSMGALYIASFGFVFQLKGKRVGIVGLGKIGTAVAKRLEAFDCRIMYNSRNEKPFVSYPFYSNVVELAGNSDVLVLCCSLNEQTRHIINREVMLGLGKDGVIINVGRGALIDEKELVRCLMEAEIWGAGLDVFENEPKVPNELFALDNVVLSPHASSFTSDSFTESCKRSAEALEVFFSSNISSTPLLDD
ncbi:unnamed protein product [Sphenostylis stenocarpa]|uniref:glyoxylate reductase (NADP(+)) n=1 Tax=Sphenostylis stenocarpa TaxID=92480 RepID=A0AA86SLU4_9FABA|nr:unnamed protein product [Sphenostylis stenocarpa]